MAQPLGPSNGWLFRSMLAGLAGLACAGTKHPSGTGSDAAVATGDSGAGLQPSDGPARVIGTDALSGDAACATATQEAQQVPLDIYLMMDSSSSMLELLTPNTTTTKWDAVRNALTSFLQDPQSAGLGVGLQYFPLVESGAPATCETDQACGNYGPCTLINVCTMAATVTGCHTNADCGRGQGTCGRLGVCGLSGGYCAPAGGTQCSTRAGDTCDAVDGYCQARDKCDLAAYAAPAVEVATLPGAAPALVASLNQHLPDGLTPTSAALRGAIYHAQARAQANPTHKVVVLLATDGLPSECVPFDFAGVQNIAAAALASTPSIPTYVIGVFGQSDMATTQPILDGLAASGGTQQAFIVNTGSANVGQAFVTALNAVRSSGRSCQYTVPAGGQDGGQIDYYRINVQFTSGAGRVATIGNVKDRASCSPTQGGWFYDVDPSKGATPRTISVCDSSCADLRADPAGRVDVLLGCKTVIIVD